MSIYIVCVLGTIMRQETKYENSQNENPIDTPIEA
jgi:hypothetical protein